MFIHLRSNGHAKSSVVGLFISFVTCYLVPDWLNVIAIRENICQQQLELESEPRIPMAGDEFNRNLEQLYIYDTQSSAVPLKTSSNCRLELIHVGLAHSIVTPQVGLGGLKGELRWTALA